MPPPQPRADIVEKGMQDLLERCPKIPGGMRRWNTWDKTEFKTGTAETRLVLKENETVKVESCSLTAIDLGTVFKRMIRGPLEKQQSY